MFFQRFHRRAGAGPAAGSRTGKFVATEAAAEGAADATASADTCQRCRWRVRRSLEDAEPARRPGGGGSPESRSGEGPRGPRGAAWTRGPERGHRRGSGRGGRDAEPAPGRRGSPLPAPARRASGGWWHFAKAISRPHPPLGRVAMETAPTGKGFVTSHTTTTPSPIGTRTEHRAPGHNSRTSTTWRREPGPTPGEQVLRSRSGRCRCRPRGRAQGARAPARCPAPPQCPGGLSWSLPLNEQQVWPKHRSLTVRRRGPRSPSAARCLRGSVARERGAPSGRWASRPPHAPLRLTLLFLQLGHTSH